MIEAKDIKYNYGALKVLDGISFKIDYGESVGIIGASGCGKTTLAKILAGLIEPTSGTILYRGDNIFNLRKKELKKFRQKVQIIFQDPFASLDPKMRIVETLREPLIIHRLVPKNKQRQKINELLNKVDLKNDILEKFPHQLSGGERQRVNIARALSVEPKLLICDEPTSSLDLPVQAKILRLLLKLKQEENLTIIFISHDPVVISAVTSRKIHLGVS